MIIRTAILAGAMSLAAAGAFAQTSPSTGSGLSGGPVSSTATGGLPDPTASTSAVGRVKPPGAPVGDNLGTRPDLEKQSQELNKRINTGICSGC